MRNFQNLLIQKCLCELHVLNYNKEVEDEEQKEIFFKREN